MYRREGNYMSLDPETATRGVRTDMSRRELIQVAYSARCGAARRIALVRLDDPTLSADFAREDPDPLVRRGLARILKDMDVLERIAHDDADGSVREAAVWRIEKLKETHDE